MASPPPLKRQELIDQAQGLPFKPILSARAVALALNREYAALCASRDNTSLSSLPEFGGNPDAIDRFYLKLAKAELRIKNLLATTTPEERGPIRWGEQPPERKRVMHPRD
jgi:hypothetical protein